MASATFVRPDDDWDTFCAVCALPLTKSTEDHYGQDPPSKMHDSPKHDWWEEAMGFRFVTTDNRESHMETYHSTPDSIRDFAILFCPLKRTPHVRGSLEYAFYMDGDRYPKPCVNDSMDEFPCIALHQRCLTMIQRLFEYRQSLKRLGLAVDGSVSLEDFWQVFCSRISPDNRLLEGFFGTRMHQPLILEPHEYFFRGGCVFPNPRQWPTGYRGAVEYEVAPYPIPNLAVTILAFLQPLPMKSSQGSEECASETKEQLPRLPVELQDKVYRRLHPFFDPPLECMHQIAPDDWKTLLFQGNLFPRLWDLDASALQGSRQHCAERDHGKLLAYDTENCWDWEQLVRQLALVEAFEHGHPMEHAPLGLRNRRRIWRLLDEARINDIEDYTTRKMDERWDSEMGKGPFNGNSQSN